MIRVKQFKLFLFIIYILLFNLNSSYAEEVSINQILKRLHAAELAYKDFSCNFVYKISNRKIDKSLNFMFDNSAEDSYKRENTIQLWIKKPFLMKTKSSDSEILIRKEDDVLHAFFWYPNNNKANKVLMPKSSWPVYPSPGSILIMLQEHLDHASSYNINKNDLGYILTINMPNFYRKDEYYIDSTRWFIYKHLCYYNNELSSTYEWQYININSGLSDSLFKIHLNKDSIISKYNLTLEK